MSCFRPLKAFRIGKKDNGKEEIKISGFGTDHLEFDGKSWIASPTNVVSQAASDVCRSYYEIPCGTCVGCRAAYTKQWADRCMLELSQHDSSYFVTLTYDDQNIKFVDHVNEETGEVSCLPTLIKKDLSSFMKRLRKNTGQDLRFYGCGEYGSHSFRPHLHVIIFGLALDDLVFYSISEGNVLYNSETIDKAWQHKGHCVVGEVTYESCAYVSGYVNKKLFGRTNDFYEYYGIEPEFTLMSRRPGIAGNFYEKEREFDYLTFNRFYVPGHQVSVPRYFLNKLRSDDPELYQQLKLKRLDVSEAITDLKLSQTDKDYLSMLKAEEDYKLKQIQFKKGGL